MLKISIKEAAPGKALLLEVEGRLAGPWVDELERSWEAERSRARPEGIVVRLSNVTFIDERGRELLSKIFHAGVGLEGSGCMVRAIIAGITGAAFSAHDCNGEKNKATIAAQSRGRSGGEQ
jgi:anti-anti-sigma regulatory factor